MTLESVPDFQARLVLNNMLLMVSVLLTLMIILIVCVCVCVCVRVCVNTDRYGWDSSVQLIERRTRDRKVPSSIPGRSGGRIFFSRVNSCADSYSVSVLSPCYHS